MLLLNPRKRVVRINFFCFLINTLDCNNSVYLILKVPNLAKTEYIKNLCYITNSNYIYIFYFSSEVVLEYFHTKYRFL